MSGRQPLARPRGFTLVEVLVAMFIMALMAALAWRGLDGVMRGRDAGRESIDRTMLLTTLLSQWQTDLQSLHQNNIIPGVLTFDGRALRLARLADGQVQLVVWWVEGGRWQRWTSAPSTRTSDLQQAWMRSQQLQGTDPATVQLLEGVSAWQIYFYRGNAWTNAQSTADLEVNPAAPAPPASAASGAAPAPPVATEQLPLAVRLVLTVDGKTLTRDIAVVPAS